MAITDQVLVALNGKQALDLLYTHCEQPNSPTCPALILLDLKIPLMNGFEFVQAYAQRPATLNPAVVIILLTSFFHPADVARRQNLPLAGYLTKPLATEKVNQLLREHFGGSAA